MKSVNKLTIKVMLLFSAVLILNLICNCGSADIKTSAKVSLGIDILLDEHLDLIQGKRVGIITNQTGVNSDGKHIIDLVFEAPEVELTALYGPEHGLRGDVEGGLTISHLVDPKTGVPIYSIYGKTKKPTPDMLQNVDVLIFDIQDVGARFYTYISTMSLCMEAAAENQISFIVLDRPNPITGTLLEGPVLAPEYQSFVGIHPIALRHGMTVGELALMFNKERWLANGIQVELHIVKMKNWRRDSWYGELGLEWIKPSPNMPSATTALLYPGMGLLESCNVSEGRGTAAPFIQIGAPWLDHVRLKQLLDNAGVAGIQIDTVRFVPVDMPGAAMNPKFKGETCLGLKLTVTEPHQFQSVAFGIHLISTIKQLHPEHFKWRSPRSPLIMFGNDYTPAAIDAGEPPDSIVRSWQPELNQFEKIRAGYLLYE